MSIKELSKYTYISKYSIYLEEKKRRETWNETVDRDRDMYIRRFPHLEKEIAEVFEAVRKKEVLPSLRSLQYGGKSIEKNNIRLYNCCATYIDRLRAIQECMYVLLCGTGAGFSVQKHHIAKLPNFAHPDSCGGTKTFVIPDSIEGWADSLGVLLSSFFQPEDAIFPEYANCSVKFDFSQVRPKGSKLSSGVGKAPGPEPLKKALFNVETILQEAQRSRTRLKPIEVFDIIMHAADAVLSGGVRRCIAKGQKVITRDGGYKNIEDIIVGDMVSTPNGWEPVTNTFIQGTQKTIKIIHQDGELICTPNHRVAVMDGHESFTWKQASELEKGDRLLFIRNIASGQKTSLPQFSYNKPPHSTTCKDIQIPELDADIAWLLGIIHGGDYVYLTSKSGYISVAIHGDDTLQAIKVKQCLERFGVDVQISPPREEDNCYRINCKSKQLAQYFQDFLKKPKQPIIIPRCIVEAIPEIRVAYLQGVLDSDGSLKTKPLHAVTTIYRDFAVQLQNLYATLGIKTRLKKLSTKNLKVGWYPKYSLSVINNIDRKKFNSISSNGFKKFRIFRACRNANSFKPEWFEEAVKPKHFHGHCCVQNKRISVDAYEKIYQHNRYVPVEILRIEEHGEVETFDIEVKSDHCFICESVLVHNSATICFFSEDDEEMMQAKTGDWYYTNKQRSRANITVPLLRNGLTRERFQKLFNYTKEYGEPGIALVDSLEALFNPCGEAGFYCYSAEGKSGFQFCNLTSINGKKCDTAEKFYKACETAAIIGTLQATFTDFPYLGSVTEEITRREALLGVSINGIMEHTNILLDPEVQSEGARIVRETNEKWAKILGINPSARSTVMKPEGTSSCLLGSASGMRPHHAKRYLRYVQANLTENVYQFLKAKNPIACQKSYWSANDESNTDGMAIFAIEVPDGSKTKDDLTAIEFLKNISLTYKHWIQGGKNIDLCVQPWISHNISNTVNVRDHEWEEVIDYVFNHLEDFCALSFLPIAGDKDYMQAPNTTVYTPREIVSEYGDASIFASGVIEKALEAFDHLWIACDVILDIKKLEQMTTEQEYWLIKAQRFTDKYFGGDTKKMTYCLKDVFNWKLYTDLQNHMVSMDYSEMVEEEDNTTFDTEVACAGGACTI